MKTLQQRRPFFLTTATNSIQGMRRPRGWLAVILSAALLCSSCASLTPERVQFWANLAQQAAQVGLQIWLAQHPEHRGNIAEILAAMGRLSVQPPGLESGVTEEQLLAALPTRVLTGEKAELFLTDKSVLIRDKKTGKAKMVDASNRETVMRAIRQGMRDALTPKPPMPERTRRVSGLTPQKAHVIYVTNQQVIVLPANEPAFATVAPPRPEPHPERTNRGTLWNQAIPYLDRTNTLRVIQLDYWDEPVRPEPPAPVVESPTPAVPAGKYSARGVGIYRVEKRQGTNWVEVQAFTGGVGEYRVRRVR